MQNKTQEEKSGGIIITYQHIINIPSVLKSAVTLLLFALFLRVLFTILFNLQNSVLRRWKGVACPICLSRQKNYLNS